MPVHLRLTPNLLKNRLSQALVALLALTGSLLVSSCDVFNRELGDGTVGTTGNSAAEGRLDSLAGGWQRDSLSEHLQMFATPQTLKAGHRDQAVVVVRVFDNNHNPISGQVVRFAAFRGAITARDTTDTKGEARADYSPIPENLDDTLLAGTVLDGKLSFVGTTVSLRGATVQIRVASKDTLVGKAIPVEIAVLDADGQGVPSVAVQLEGSRDDIGKTDASGIFHTTVLRSDAGTVRIKASAIGASDSLSVGFFTGSIGSRSNNLVVYVDPGRVVAAEGVTAQVKAILYDDRHNPVVGKTISFAASHGRISGSAKTDSQGVATASFFSIPLNVDATVSASASLADSLKTASALVTLTGVTVAIQPSVEDALLTDSVSVAIRVKDGLGKPVADAPVSLIGTSITSGRTNAGGLLTIRVGSSQEKSVTLEVAALGATDNASVRFWTTLPKNGLASSDAVGNLRIFVEPSHLKASNTDQAKVKVVAFDNLNNPIAGRQVRFTTQRGIITALDTTDAQGEATATLRAIPYNINSLVTATMSVEDSSLTVATKVTFEGLRIEVIPATQNALVNSEVQVMLRLTDGAGAPVPNEKISFDGNTIVGGTFVGGTFVGTTDGAGVLYTGLTNGLQKRVVLVASALGARDSGFVDFWKVLPGKEQVVDSIRELRLFSSRSQLRADNTDFATITVILSKPGNNPAVGEIIHFTSNLGLINATARVDSTGRAQVTLRSVPVNGTCRVTATTEGRNLSATTEVLFSGVTLQLLPEKTDYKVGDDAILDAFLKDGSGNPIGGDVVDFTASGAAGIFNNGSDKYSITLNPVGRAQIRVRSSSAGTVKVLAQSLNTADSVNLRFSNNSLTLTVDKSALGISGSDSIRVTATYVDGGNNPVAGAAIRFAASAGFISPAATTTDASGQAVAYVKAASFSATATVQATAPGGTAQTQVTYTAGVAARIKLEITPDNIAINGGLANLRATVTDAQGNRVTGQDVNFRILQGPGGGEIITKPVAQSQAGVALTQLQSGSVPSSYRGVSVEARVGNFADTSKLTLSGPAFTITISRPEDDSVTGPKGGSIDASTFRANLGAVVQDINGNPVADGTEVHFSAVVTGMAIRRLLNDGWSGVGSVQERKPRYKSYYQDIPFEDINGNRSYDPNIDLSLDGNLGVSARGEDRNGDGKYDWDASKHDYWFDFNGNGICDAGVAEDPAPYKVPGDSVTLYHDLNNDGMQNPSELIIDRGVAGCNDQPLSGDFPFHLWETRLYLASLPFIDNDFAVAIPVSFSTKAGVADVQLTYPRQFAQRLIVTVNAEVNGIRDKDGERFILPKIVGQ